MIASERREAIMNELRLRGLVSVAEFAPRLGVAPVTLRRDLRELENEGQLTRVHGGARHLQRPVPQEPGSAQSRRQLAATFGLAPFETGDGNPVATIGMIAPTSTYYYAEAIEGARQAAELAGVRLVLAISDYNEAEERRIFERMTRIGLDGILVTPSRSGYADGPLRDLIEDSPVPVTVVERIWEFPTRGRVVDSVRSDHEHGARIAVDHLAELGHRHIAVWSYENPHAHEVTAGARRAAERLGITVHTPEFDYGHPDWNSVDLTQNVRRYLHGMRDAGVTAVLVHPDQQALQFVQCALDEGLSIPGDITVVAYDDEVAGLSEMPLTAVSPPKKAIGFVALDACLRAVAHASAPERAFPPQRIRLMPELKIRASSGPPPATGGARPGDPRREASSGEGGRAVEGGPST
ncbi:substrate-binding domain-containing protein [Streptomyces sp. ISL-12]|uniref:substrate-binding domain-containing protein n=1 Tax=Streptomyces sp. ISL-12 TaxID=2819177 RepID=UPI001BE8AB10|nr:substrate-binding domain-containing protein [Streptomyces sp. ISL-12]MBT2411524.1 substrate-binding domain-containing protein [Streptomyces sp. ISL-12]